MELPAREDGVRIVTGEAGGRRFGRAPQGIRPTSGRVRKTLFDILGDRVEGRSLLDLCAGIGGLGLEGLSRGAACALFVDNHPPAVRAVRENLSACRFESRARVWLADALKALNHIALHRARVDLILADPPYETPLSADIVRMVADLSLLNPEGMLVLEHARRDASPEPSGSLSLIRRREAGDTALSFYRNRNADPPLADFRILLDLPPPASGRRP